MAQKLLFPTHWLYENTVFNTHRYILGERGDRMLVCVGVNPSTAQPGLLDPTLKNVKSISKALGYDGWMMINLYPLRATNPNDLPDTAEQMAMAANLENIHKYVSNLPRPVNIWPAWGTLISKRPYLWVSLRRIVEMFGSLSAQWWQIGERTKDGHPHHPLYLSHKNLLVQPFDQRAYLEVCRQKFFK